MIISLSAMYRERGIIITLFLLEIIEKKTFKTVI